MGLPSISVPSSAKSSDGHRRIRARGLVDTMVRKASWMTVIAGLILMVAGQGHAADRGPEKKPRVRALTALDYIEIQQLVAKFSFAVDYCGHGGQDIADLFTEDGVYTVTVDRFEPRRGREQLATVAGGTDCEFVKSPSPGYLLSRAAVNLVIEATAEGAKGRSYTLYPGRNGEFYKTWAGHVGGYQDIYVKTSQGWRFKSRVHVLPPHVPGEYELR